MLVTNVPLSPSSTIPKKLGKLVLSLQQIIREGRREPQEGIVTTATYDVWQQQKGENHKNQFKEGKESTTLWDHIW